MQITSGMKLADMINLNFMLLPVISRFNIKLGCGEKTIREVCRDNDVNTGFFLEIINSFHDRNYFPEKNLQEFPLHFITDYLKKSHEYYLAVKLPYIIELIKKFLEQMNEGDKKLPEMILEFFNNYTEEIKLHLKREDTIVFPYVAAVEKVFLSHCLPDDNTRSTLENYSMDVFIIEHDNIEDKLYDLKNLIIKYIPPGNDINLTNNIIIELFRLETDLNDHARIEDKVLVPKVRYMEKWIHDHCFQKPKTE